MNIIDVATLEARVTGIINTLPPGVSLVAAAKTRTPEEIQAAVRSGVLQIGYNYVQEAAVMQRLIGRNVQWYLIGHLQRNKIKKSVQIFDMIQTLDSIPLAESLNTECRVINKKMPVLIEINSGREINKTGILPEDAVTFIDKIRHHPHLHIQGLMTMGSLYDDPEKIRPYFQLTRKAFERVKEQNWPEVEMRYLSMGMSDSYTIAIEEGANMVRLGTILFGPRVVR